MADGLERPLSPGRAQRIRRPSVVTLRESDEFSEGTRSRRASSLLEPGEGSLVPARVRRPSLGATPALSLETAVPSRQQRRLSRARSQELPGEDAPRQRRPSKAPSEQEESYFPPRRLSRAPSSVEQATERSGWRRAMEEVEERETVKALPSMSLDSELCVGAPPEARSRALSVDSEAAAGPDRDVEKVLKRLEDVSSQLDGLAEGQRFQEKFMRRLYQDLSLGIPPSAKRMERKASIRPDPQRMIDDEASPPDSLKSPCSIKVTRTSESQANNKDVLGFWPRAEWHLAFTTRSHPGSVIKGMDIKLLGTQSAFSEKKESWFRPIHPDSWFRAIFDFCSVLVLVYDSFLFPYQFALDVPMEGWLLYVSWADCGFWATDLFLGFVTGWHDKDGVVMSFAQISRRHLCTSFLPDFVVLAADIIAIVRQQQLSYGDNGSRETLLLKLLRFLKLRRVLRLASSFRHGKVADLREWLFQGLRRRGLHEQFEIMRRIFSLVFYILWVNHAGSCLWQMVGSHSMKHWFVMHDLDMDQSDASNYMLGFYFSATAMISGGSVVMPSTTPELIVLVGYIVVGFIVSSILISSLLATYMEYEDNNRERKEKLKHLQQFLYQHSIAPRLAVPIVKQIHERMWSKKQLAEGDVEALSLLSPMMRSELWHHLYGPNFLTNPFLFACNAIRSGLIKEVIFRALRRTSHPPGTLIFEPGQEAVGAHFVCQGTLDYYAAQAQEQLSDTDDMSSGNQRSMVPRPSSGNKHVDNSCSMATEGCWISEVAFWAHWLHRGWLDARTPCELMTVEAEKFVQVLVGNTELVRLVQSYTSCMLKALEESGPDFSDLQSLPHHSIVAAMPLDQRVVLSKAAMDTGLKEKRFGRGWNYSELQELKEEINAGSCDLVMTKDEVRRVVTVVALRLRRCSDGCILARIGKCVKGVPTTSCELPGSKVKVGEYPRTAMERFMREKLGTLSEHIVLGGQSMDVQEKVSKSYGLKSKYYRVIFEAELTEEPVDYMQILSKMTTYLSTASTGGGVSRPQSHSLSLVHSMFRAESDISSATEAFVFRRDAEKDPENLVLFAWMRPDEYRSYSSSAGEEQLQQWVSDLDWSSISPDLQPPLPPLVRKAQSDRVVSI